MKWIDAKMKVSVPVCVVIKNQIITMCDWTVTLLCCTLFLPKGGSVNQFNLQYLGLEDKTKDSRTEGNILPVCVCVRVGAGSDRQP